MVYKIPVTLLAVLLVSVIIRAQSAASPVAIDAGVFRKNSPQFVENLTAEDFEILEDNRPQKILSAKAESRPLSVVVISTLGQGTECGKLLFIYPDNSALSNDMILFGTAMEQSVTKDDQLAILTTDEKITRLRGFDAGESIEKGFIELTRKSDHDEETIDERASNASSDDSGRVYAGVRTNFIKEAFYKAFDYLKQNKKPENRSVILLLRTVYNPSNLTDPEEEALKSRFSEENIVFNWIGDGVESVFNKMIPVAKFYRTLPQLSGGLKEPCSALKSKKLSALKALIGKVLAPMRSSYRITYVPDRAATAGQSRLLTVRLSNEGRRKANGSVIINAPQYVSKALN